MSTQTAGYGASNITVLEGLEAVRKRPGMYIGNTGKDGLHRCFGEILDNCVDEFMAGKATTVRVKINEKGSILVADDGRGIPTDIHPKTGKSTLETIMTVLHAGGKFDQNSYQFSGGLHGVGASVVNALSDLMRVWVLRDGKVNFLSFSKGKTIGDVVEFDQKLLASKYPEIIESLVWKKNGTVVEFFPDKEIFETIHFDAKLISDNLKQNAYLNKGLKIIVETIHDFKNEDETIINPVDTVVEYCYPEGILTYLEDITRGETLETPIISFASKTEKFELEAAVSYSSEYNEKLFAFTNGIINPEGGAHVTGFKMALTKLINNYATSKNFFKKESDRFTTDDLREGMRIVLSIKMVDPQFTSQSKVKLGSTIARTLTDRMVTEQLGTYLEENPSVSMSILQKAQLAMKARLAAKAARDTVLRKGVLESMSLPGKLADCSEKDPTKCELYLVEGDSAGGSAKQGRDRHIQAILPLRGKVLNTERATLDRILNYEGIKNMIIALGTGIGDKYDVEKLRYHKLILMTDADVDGAHITTLLLTFLFRFMPDLIENGYVYMARPPLYKISYGKKHEYVYSDPEKDALVKKIHKQYGADIEIVNEKADVEENNEEKTATNKKKIKIDVQRYKGLGEMNPDQLWDTTMNPATRLLYQVTVGEAALADQVFDELMGANVEPRKRFIEENAQFIEVEMI